MPIPDLYSITKPLLEFLADEKPRTMTECYDAMAKFFNLTDEEIEEKVKSGQRKFYNRVIWARVELKMASLIESQSKKLISITKRGIETIKAKPDRIDRKSLMIYPEYSARFKRDSTSTKPNIETINIEATPQETIENAYNEIYISLKEELKSEIKNCSPYFFERLVVDLLVKMGYGGTYDEASSIVTKKSGDEGIDGVIKEDKLGLDNIYIQAKKWEGNVSRPEIQKFAGALMGQKAKKGVFITTSDFTKEAVEYAKNIESKIVLISGEMLEQFMIDYDLGVSTERSYAMKRIDSDYFNNY